MRTEGLKTFITIPIPYDRPDKNGTVHTKESVQHMIESFNSNKPIVFRANEDDTERCIGFVSGRDYSVDWDDESQTCWFNIDGRIFYGGADIVVNEMKDGQITSFEIRSIGLSE